MELAIASAIFFGIPVGLIGYTAWLIWSVAPDVPDHFPMGDATETPRMNLDVRRSNHKAEP
jgi:hypothetical protein